MKPYPAVMKEKRRYAVFELVSEGKHDKAPVVKALWDSIFDSIGAFGAAESAFWVIDFDEPSQKGILRCTNKNMDKIRGCLALIDRVNNKKAFVHILRVTGTIRKSRSLLGLKSPKG